MATLVGFPGVLPGALIAATGLAVVRRLNAADVLADHGTESTGEVLR